MPKNAHTVYTAELTAHLQKYSRTAFPEPAGLFDSAYSERNTNPPVFTKETAHRNLLLPADENRAAHVRNMVTEEKRHRWFRSMKSSQVLAQSVFGNLFEAGHLDLLTKVEADDGGPAFGSGRIYPSQVLLEESVGYELLHEPRPTNVDVWIRGRPSVCIECKLAEAEVGACSRPRLPEKHDEHCGKEFCEQGGWRDQCVLSSRGIDYWKYVPKVIREDALSSSVRCPLWSPYQLVRNILAACVENGTLALARGHALVVYDARNPVFQPHAGGTFEKLREQLIEPSVLRRCSWQSIMSVMADYNDLKWLVRSLEQKYGLLPLH
jgi:hypothetical protein